MSSELAQRTDEVAAHLVFERPDLLEASTETIAGALGVDLGVVKSWFRDASFRTSLDRYLSWRAISPDVRLAQYRVLRDISLDRDAPGEAIKAFEVLSRQAGVKVAERHEVDDRKTVEVTVKHAGFVEGGFVPESRFQAPSSRREAIGGRVEKDAPESTGSNRGPFEYGVPQLTVGQDSGSGEET